MKTIPSLVAAALGLTAALSPAAASEAGDAPSIHTRLGRIEPGAWPTTVPAAVRARAVAVRCDRLRVREKRHERHAAVKIAADCVCPQEVVREFGD